MGVSAVLGKQLDAVCNRSYRVTSALDTGHGWKNYWGGWIRLYFSHHTHSLKATTMITIPGAIGCWSAGYVIWKLSVQKQIISIDMRFTVFFCVLYVLYIISIISIHINI